MPARRIARSLHLALFALGVLLAVVARSATAQADATLVVLARPPSGAVDASPGAVDLGAHPGAALDRSPGGAIEVVNRFRGELVADGFQVVVVDFVAAPDRPGAVVRAARTASSRLAAGVFVEGSDGNAELVLVDTFADRVSRRRPPMPPDPTEPEVVARRTVDFLRASLLDFVVESLRTAAPRAQPSVPPPLEILAPVSHWALEAGAAGLFSFQGVGPAIAPMIRARFEPTRAYAVRVTAAWLASRPTVQTALGSADVEQGIALVEGALTLWTVPALRLRASFGTGIYYVAVDGNGSPLHEGVHSATVAAAIDAGLGAAIPLGPHFEAIVEAHALASAPGIAVRFLDVEAARVGRPTVLATLTFAAWL